MNFKYKHLLPEDFDEQSKVWIYQASRRFTLSEALEIETMLEDLVKNWKSHGADVTGYANLFFGQFIILMADERAAGVSGCSTDSAVRIVKQIQETFKVDMFNWQNLAFVIKDDIQILPRTQFKYAWDNGFIKEYTLFFNNTVNTKTALQSSWMIPVKDSWLISKISQPST